MQFGSSLFLFTLHHRRLAPDNLPIAPAAVAAAAGLAVEDVVVQEFAFSHKMLPVVRDGLA